MPTIPYTEILSKLNITVIDILENIPDLSFNYIHQYEAGGGVNVSLYQSTNEESYGKEVSFSISQKVLYQSGLTFQQHFSFRINQNCINDNSLAISTLNPFGAALSVQGFSADTLFNLIRFISQSMEVEYYTNNDYKNKHYVRLGGLLDNKSFVFNPVLTDNSDLYNLLEMTYI